MEYYSAFKKKEILSLATTWINLEDMVNEISQSQKDKYCRILLTGLVKLRVELVKAEHRMVVARSWK